MTGSQRSPAGHIIEPGTVDENGYVLPLDVIALKKHGRP